MMEDDLRISWLDSFVQVAELRSQTAAAKALGFSQPKVSRNVQHLERWLRSPLFDGSVPPSLSPFGEQFLQTAKGLLQSLRESRLDPQSVMSAPAPAVSGRDIVIP